jgi:hypothetical protein
MFGFFFEVVGHYKKIIKGKGKGKAVRIFYSQLSSTPWRRIGGMEV